MKKPLLLLVLPLLVSCNEPPSPRVIYDEPVKDNKSHVILLAGDEDCLGFSYSYHLTEFEGVSDQKFKEYTNGYDNVKISYRNMLTTKLVHKEQTSFIKTRLGQGKAPNEGIKYGCLGPEVGIAEVLSNFKQDETFYIIKFAGGGESNFKYQWNIDHGVYYQKMNTFFEEQLLKLKNSNIDFDVSAFMFVQGESDAKNGEYNYKEYLENFVNDIKVRYQEYAPKNGMMFLDSGVSSYYHLSYRDINSAKKEIMDSDSRNYYIDTINADISRNDDNMDRKHFDAKGEIKLGNLFGKAYLSFNEVNEKVAFEIKDKGQEKTLTNSFAVESIKDGETNKSEFAFDNQNVTVKSTNSNISINDGISIKYVEASDDESVDINNLKMVNLYVDNSVSYYVYSSSQQKLVETTQHPNFEQSVELVKDNRYQMSLKLPKETGKIYVSFGNIINDKPTYSRELNTETSNINTYPSIANNNLDENNYVMNSNFFGNVSNLRMTEGWDLSNDTGDNPNVTITSGNALNTLYAYKNNSNKLSFSASITANSVINFDLYPKFGIILVDDEFNGIFYYVDAAGNGSSMEGVDLGYCLVTGGVFSDYVSFNYSVGSPVAYQYGNYIKLGIDRNEDLYTFSFGESEVRTLQNVTNFGLSKAYFGLNTFNVAITAKDYVME